MSYKPFNSFGIMTPTKVNNPIPKHSDYLNQFVIFQPRNVAYKGYIRWHGSINDILVYGIETLIKMDCGTNGTFNKIDLFRCSNETGIIVEDSVKILKIDENHQSVAGKSFRDLSSLSNTDIKFERNDLIVVRIKKQLKVGKFYEIGKINDVLCCGVKFENDSHEYIYLSTDILGKFADNDGIVNAKYDGAYKPKRWDNAPGIGSVFKFKHGDKTESGTIKWKGTIDGLQCIGVDPENTELISNFTRTFSDENAYWTVICLDVQSNMIGKRIPNGYREISNPIDVNIFTHYKLKAYVKDFDNNEGVVENFVFDENDKFHYGIILDGEKYISYFALDEVKCGTPTYIDNGAFQEVNDPSEYGIITTFKKNDYVKVKPSKYNQLDGECFGQIVWMGFDKDSTFKFFLELDNYNEKGQSGYLYGQTLCEVEDKYGLLVLPSCIVPTYMKDHEISKNDNKNQSKLQPKYCGPRSKISCGENKGIQGDKNSCYMDTSLFAMFMFQEIFDNLLYSNENSKVSENSQANGDIQNILRSHIIFPLRSYEYVSFERVSTFRQKLGDLFPNKKFIHSEKDPEELLETLFHLFTPKDPLLNTFHMKTKLKQSCFLMQLFYVNKIGKRDPSIGEMLNLTFLEGDMLMDKPPKCLILQLPRHGNKYKNYDEVRITSGLDITHLIRCCKNKCKMCTEEESVYVCKTCSEVTSNFTYFCNEHKTSCKHDKYEIKNKTNICLTCKKKANNCCDICSNEKDKFIYLCEDHKEDCDHHKTANMCFKGKVQLELFAILCIEKTHYVAYVKTGEVTRKWIYFDSMASVENSELKPNIREAPHIDEYFQNGTENDSNNEDVLKIKNFAFVCFYKNPAMEYYWRDFNHIN